MGADETCGGRACYESEGTKAREKEREGNVMPEATTTLVRVRSAVEEKRRGEVDQWSTVFPWHNEQV